MKDDQKDGFFIEGTYASLRYFIPEDSPAHAEAWKIFEKIKWAKPPKRDNGIRSRFDAFSALLWAVTEDEDWVVHTDLNKSSYAVMKWPTPYNAMRDTMDALKEMGWLKQVGERKQFRQLRYVAPPRTPMRKMKPFKISQRHYYWPDIQVRRGRTDLDKAPMDVEWMSIPANRKLIDKYLRPTMDDLNQELADHEFTLFNYGKEDDWVEVIYRRVYTTITSKPGKDATKHSRLTHGRIYPNGFSIPSKKKV
jgi:hypothetical protein